jgi:hypothetical protein
MIKICNSCHQHFLAIENECQNCTPQQSSLISKAPMLALILGLGVSCGDKNETDPSVTALYGDPGIDEDQDGYFMQEDCDDSDANTYPGAAELDSTTECMTDADNDGYGDMDSVSPIVAGTDCNDSDDNTNPAAEEIQDGIDNNCDGEVDEFVGDLYGVPE